MKVNDRSEVLDAVRGIAIAFVVGRHYLPQYNTFGAMGVDLFFVLSGYLIGGVLIDNRDALPSDRVGAGRASWHHRQHHLAVSTSGERDGRRATFDLN